MILGRQSGLGRGLGALIPPKPTSTSTAEGIRPASDVLRPATEQSDGRQTTDVVVSQIPIELVRPNPHQPREHFDHTGLEELVSSIQEHGVMQPIVVTKRDDGAYELIAGERRLRASTIAGRKTIPAIVRTATEQQKLELAMIENIQRQDLHPLEEARAYLQLQNDFSMTQDEIAKKMGKSRSQVANMIRLLQLPHEIQEALQQGKISTSNARTLLSFDTEEEQLAMFRSMLEGNFTVRQTEARIPHRRPRKISIADPNLEHLEKEIRNALGVKVSIKRDAHGEGEIRIAFFNDEDLQGIAKKITKSTE